jgi:hypothetical protein
MRDPRFHHTRVHATRASTPFASMQSRVCLAPIAAAVALLAVVSQGCGSAAGPVGGRERAVWLPAKALALVIQPTTAAVLAETGSGIYVLPRGKDRGPRRLQPMLVTADQRLAIGKTLTLAYTGDGGLIGSAHPDNPDPRVPADLGLLASRDDAKTWQNVSLYGKADPHILRAAGPTLYAVDFATAALKLIITNDYGHTWTPQPPGLITDKGLLFTHDQAHSWIPAATDARALSWAPGGPLYLGGLDGSIRASADGDSSPELRGSLGTSVLRLTTGRRGALWAIGADRTVRDSTDGGRRWTIRYRLREREQ